MLRSRFLFTVLLTALIVQATSGRADDWPGWRGPFRDSISTETGLLRKWPEEGPAKVWTSQQAGAGYSSFAVVGDTLLTLGADDENDLIIALEVATGNKKWSTPLGPRWQNRWGDGPRGTPTVSGDLVVALGGRGNLVCVSADSGDVRWSVDL